MNTSDVLNLAADLIEERGWGQGNEAMRGDGAPICLEGGIAAAAGMKPSWELEPGVWIFSSIEVHDCPAYAAVSNYLANRPDEEWMPFARRDRDLWGWNDAQGRTADEVVAVLRAAAVVEAARESQPSEVSA